ncbi:phytanoyl-CoA dioxygenase family protein [Lizonia empirigonia]|nr:phytanoyl-CoA dioxygenase family protein [Lizonia empirigonia]
MSSGLSSTPISISVSAAEKGNGLLTEHNLEIATRALARDGLVVLEDMIDHAVLDRLNEKMVEDAYELQGRKDSPFNYNKGNIQQDPPLTSDYFVDDIYLNPIVTQVTSTTLGPHPSLRFISGNTALPPTPTSPPLSQPTHTDADFDHPPLPFALVINIPLVTMTPANGSTEIWLGTHTHTSIADQEGAHGERASGRIKPDLLSARRHARPPCQPVVPRGSVVVRDLRLWHGGMPNLGDTPRVMLALIHFAPWFRNQMSVDLSAALQARVQRETGVVVCARYLPDEQVRKTYLDRPFGNAYDFDQVERVEGVF